MQYLVFWQYGETLKQLERRIVAAAYMMSDHDTTKTAKLLGLSERCVRYKVQRMKRELDVRQSKARVDREQAEMKFKQEILGHNRPGVRVDVTMNKVEEVKEALKPRPVMEPSPVRR